MDPLPNGLGMLLHLKAFVGSERRGHYRLGNFTGPTGPSHDGVNYRNM